MVFYFFLLAFSKSKCLVRTYGSYLTMGTLGVYFQPLGIFRCDRSCFWNLGMWEMSMTSPHL